MFVECHAEYLEDGTDEVLLIGEAQFESNFSVEKKSVSYLVLWYAFKKIAAKLLPGD